MENQILPSRDLIAVLPLICLVLASFVPILMKVLRKNREPKAISSFFVGMIGLLLASGLTFSMVHSLLKLSGKASIAVFNEMLVIDGMGLWISYLVYLLGAFGLMLSYDSAAVRGRQFAEYIFLFLNSLVGVVLVAWSNDLIITFIAIEFMSLTLYLLIATGQDKILSKEAAFKYFVLGSFAAAFFLFGISLVYGAVGSTALSEVVPSALELLSTSKIFVAGFTLVILGLAFKVSVFPFHSWTPDVYQGAATPVTTVMSTAVKAASFLAFLRLFAGSDLFRLESSTISQVLQWLAVLTMTAGNFAALQQSNLKRMLAYSSVAHSGYLMVGLIAAGFGSNFDSGATCLLFYIFSYSLMTVGTFALVSLFEKHADTHVSMNDLKGLGKKSPLIAFCFFILLISLAGVPPTLGFFGKLYLFSSALEQGLVWLVVWGVLNSVVSVYYYLRPVVYMFMSEGEESPYPGQKLMTSSALLFAAIVIIALGFASAPLLRVVQKSVVIGM